MFVVQNVSKHIPLNRYIAKRRRIKQLGLDRLVSTGVEHCLGPQTCKAEVVVDAAFDNAHVVSDAMAKLRQKVTGSLQNNTTEYCLCHFIVFIERRISHNEDQNA